MPVAPRTLVSKKINFRKNMTKKFFKANINLNEYENEFDKLYKIL
jgi:hypothetical protein